MRACRDEVGVTFFDDDDSGRAVALCSYAFVVYNPKKIKAGISRSSAVSEPRHAGSDERGVRASAARFFPFVRARSLFRRRQTQLCGVPSRRACVSATAFANLLFVS